MRRNAFSERYCVLYLLFVLGLLSTQAEALLKCPDKGGGSSGGGGEDETTVFDFGEPIMFVSSYSQNHNPYSLVDQQRITSILHEYLMVGYKKIAGRPGIYEKLRMVLLDSVKAINTDATKQPDVVHQNLEKELYWRFFNSTGVYPWMTIMNTTFEKRIAFRAGLAPDSRGKGIAYNTQIREGTYLYEPQPPYDAVFEIPANSRVLKSTKTLVQYQSFSLWRWKLSEKTVEWEEVASASGSDNEATSEPDFKRIDNPCTKDLFLLTTGHGSGQQNHFYLNSPLIQSHLKENWFYDMVTEDHPWYPDVPVKMILTNDHLVVLTNYSLWVSQSLNDTLLEEEDLLIVNLRVHNFTERPLLSFREVDPCAGLEETIQCFDPRSDNSTTNNIATNNSTGGNTTTDSTPTTANSSAINSTATEPTPLSTDSIGTNSNSFDDAGSSTTEHKLFYNPACYLYQVPTYMDYIIFAIKSWDGVEDKFSVLYAATPYSDWRVLFSDVYYYRQIVHKNGVTEPLRFYIRDIIGIIYNHHTNNFDITIAVNRKPRHRSKKITVSETGNINSNTTQDNWTSDESGKAKNEEAETNIYIRFFLRGYESKSRSHGFIVEKLQGDFVKRELTGTVGNGWTDFIFPENFQVDSVVMNGETQDIFFLGNQLWISESGSPFIYPSVTGLPRHYHKICSEHQDRESGLGIELEFPTNSNNGPTEPENSTTKQTKASLYPRIRECSFNHPDRVFVCLTENRELLLAGKIGSHYTPYATSIVLIPELHQAQIVHGWSSAYLCEVVTKRAVFIAGYSGKILMWFMYDPKKAEEKSSSVISNPDSDPMCDPSKTYNEFTHICSVFRQWSGCTIEPSPAKPEFQMVTINPVNLPPRQISTEGPLVPFIVDSYSALLFEAEAPPDIKKLIKNPTLRRQHYYTYLSNVNVGHMVYCHNYGLLKKDVNNPTKVHDCEMYIRHVKSVEGYLAGYRRVLYVMIIKPFPMVPVPADIVVLVHANSNNALIAINDHIHEPPWTFTVNHIGQTLYLPGNFSVLLSGFPKEGNTNIMQGFTTLHEDHEVRLVYHAFHTFLIDLGTPIFRAVQHLLTPDLVRNETERLNRTVTEMEGRRLAEQEMRAKVAMEWENSSAAALLRAQDLFKGELPRLVTREEEENELLTVKDNERSQTFPVGSPKGEVEPPEVIPEDDLYYGKTNETSRSSWYVDESGCDFILKLTDNSVIKMGGGRISLDLHDKISFEVKLKAKTAAGRLMTYRPLLAITNSNPHTLKIEKREKLLGNPQVIRVMMTPTSFQKGVAVVSVRSLVTSLKCQHESSFTFIVLLHRDVGRRLHINYPIPVCKPTGQFGMYPRRWHTDQEGCISRDDLLDQDKPEIFRYRQNRRHVTYITLPPNYRPPSFDGEDIPISKNIYNADPTKPKYKSWYGISRETFKYERCEGANEKSECRCSENDRLTDDEAFTECKEKVFHTFRTGAGKPLELTAEYDRLMRDEDQLPEFLSPKLNWSVTIEEVNARSEWYMVSPPTPYLVHINFNRDDNLSEGMRHYDMKSFSVGLLGTGLYHFKVTLGRFESFDEVCGYFIMYVGSNDFNHLHHFMILLGTIIFCMTMVFLGFLWHRKRLSSMLPIQQSTHVKLKLA